MFCSPLLSEERYLEAEGSVDLALTIDHEEPVRFADPRCAGAVGAFVGWEFAFDRPRLKRSSHGVLCRCSPSGYIAIHGAILAGAPPEAVAGALH